MVRLKSVLCENCGEESLQWYPELNEGDGGFLCPSWRSYSNGLGCFHVVTMEEFEERCKRREEVEENQDIGEEKEGPFVSHYDKKAQNVAALLSGELVISRQPLLPRVLSVSDCDAVIRKPFKSPCPGANSQKTAELLRRLNARKRFVPWCSSRDASLPTTTMPSPLCSDFSNDSREELSPDIEPLVLWEPEEHQKADEKLMPIVVDPHLVRYLRPHQRDGVQFMFECVTGLREFSKSNSSLAGCILADDMGLGKTLQSITLVWTLLKQGFDGSPIARRVLIVTPTSLVSNWEAEIEKWLAGQVRVIALCESTRADVISGISTFLAPCSGFQVLILSYETFRLHAKKLQLSGSCDLLICDEAHRLKNSQTRTNKALAGLSCHRRVLLSGTPIQNDLEEFFAMVNFTNPGILGDASSFRRYFEAPILSGREPTATNEDKIRGAQRSAELSDKVNQFILRRTNNLLSNHLPPKIIEIVCCKLTNVQEKLYKHFIQSKNLRQVLQDTTKRARVLSSILALKKLCNHPMLIYESAKSGCGAKGFEDCPESLLSEGFLRRNNSCTGADSNWIDFSGKMSVLARLLENLRDTTNDRIVLVSNYTQTLELFAQLCREKKYPYLKLDGTTSISKRQKLVQKFNNPMENEFAFLLSSKAGGCGLNLIGGNRLVLFDPDWNPANDKQAAARVWRDGQKKRVFIYRFLSAGTIEEKVFERQLSKEGLQKVVEHQEVNENHPQGTWLSSEELRDLFSFRENTKSNIHNNLNCKRCPGDCSTWSSADDMDSTGEDTDIGSFANIADCLQTQRAWEKQIGAPLEEDLKNWGHHSQPATVPDKILQASAGDEVNFVFTCQIDGKLLPVESSCPDMRGVVKAPSLSKEHGMKISLRGVLQPISGQNYLSWPSRKKFISDDGVRASPVGRTTRSLYKPPHLVKSKNVEQKSGEKLPRDSDDDEFM